VYVFTVEAAACLNNIEPKQSSSLLNMYMCRPVLISGVSELRELVLGVDPCVSHGGEEGASVRYALKDDVS
jgi:hypothetical protein